MNRIPVLQIIFKKIKKYSFYFIKIYCKKKKKKPLERKRTDSKNACVLLLFFLLFFSSFYSTPYSLPSQANWLYRYW